MPGVYISYPFCAQKCTYCNFASGVFPRELEPRISTRCAPKSEVDGMAMGSRDGISGRRHAQPDRSRSAGSLLAAIPGQGPWLEATMEAAPGRSPEKAAAWRRAGSIA